MAKSALRKPRLDAPGFPARLRTLRVQRGWGQAEMAEKVGITPLQYGRYERGQSGPTAEGLRRIAEVLGASADYLLQGENSPDHHVRLEDPNLLRLFQEAEKLPVNDRTIIAEFIDAFIFKRRVQQMTHN